MGCPSAGSFHLARVAAPARSWRSEATPSGHPRPEDGRTGRPAVPTPDSARNSLTRSVVLKRSAKGRLVWRHRATGLEGSLTSQFRDHLLTHLLNSSVPHGFTLRSVKEGPSSERQEPDSMTVARGGLLRASLGAVACMGRELY